MKLNSKILTSLLCSVLCVTMNTTVMAAQIPDNDFKETAQLSNSTSTSEKFDISEADTKDEINLNDLKGENFDSIDSSSIDLNSLENTSNEDNLFKLESDTADETEEESESVMTYNAASDSEAAADSDTAETSDDDTYTPYLVPYILNEDSLKDGQITTGTQILWMWNTDADENTVRTIANIPGAYVTTLDALGLEDSGFITAVTEPGDYTLVYYEEDSAGNISPIVYTFTVVPSEDYEFYQGTFTSADDVRTYDISIDFSNKSAAAVALVQPNDTKFTLTLTDSTGNVVKTISGPQNWFYINKPSSGAGVCNYTATLKPTSFVSDSSDFEFMVGDKNCLEAMMSGAKAAITLKTNRVDDFHQFINAFTPVKNMSWFKFHSDGSSVITALTDHPELRFQIRDINNRTILWDSDSESSAHRDQYCYPFNYAEKVNLNIPVGDYYLVLYTTNLAAGGLLEDSVNITVGEPHYTFDSKTFYSSSSLTIRQNTFNSVPVYVSGLPKSAVIKDVFFKTQNSFGMSKVNYWKIKAPNKSYWFTSEDACYPMITCPYIQGSSTNSIANGTWYMAIRSSSYADGTLVYPGMDMQYYYEMGD